MYRNVQTGANNQLGGLKDGLFAVAYQPFTPLEVKKPETKPVTSGISNDVINFSWENYQLEFAILFIVRNQESRDLIIT